MAELNLGGLPTQAALADASANPTLSQVSTYSLIFNGTTWDRARSGLGDAGAVTGLLNVGLMVFNGTNFDRVRNNIEKTLLASAARTATTDTPVQTIYNGKGVILCLNISANPGGAETLNMQLALIDPVTGSGSNPIANFVTAAAVNDIYRLIVYPGSSGTPETSTRNKTYALAVSRRYVVSIVPSGAGSWTYSLGANEIP